MQCHVASSDLLLLEIIYNMDSSMATPASVAETPDLDKLLLRPGYIVGPGFEHGPELKSMLHDDIRVLVVGAGGLGCELLKDLGA